MTPVRGRLHDRGILLHGAPTRYAATRDAGRTLETAPVSRGREPSGILRRHHRRNQARRVRCDVMHVRPGGLWAAHARLAQERRAIDGG